MTNDPYWVDDRGLPHGEKPRYWSAVGSREIGCDDETMGFVDTAELADLVVDALRWFEHRWEGGGRYRVGRRVGRTLYQDDEIIGLMDTGEYAALVATALNHYERNHPEGALCPLCSALKSVA